MEANRTSDVKRNTQETKIEISLDLDGQKAIEINSGIPFFDHMLNAFAKHGGFGLRLHCDGDLEIDAHHSMEDIGLALGQALRTALGDKRGITRFGHSYVPLDESLARTVIDLSGRPHLSWRAEFPEAEAGGVSCRLYHEFFRPSRLRGVPPRAGIDFQIVRPRLARRGDTDRRFGHPVDERCSGIGIVYYIRYAFSTERRTY